MVDIDVKIEDQLIVNNTLLIKSICILWLTKAHDMLFIPNMYDIKIKIKGGNILKDILFNLSESCEELDNNNGFLIGNISSDIFKKIKMVIKMTCNLNIMTESQNQSGSFAITIDKNKYQIRASFHPSNFGECLSLRIIRSDIFNNINHIAHLLHKKGLILIGGRTASGKTTLQYASLVQFAGHIITLEDPVELYLPNITQTDISYIGYEEGVKSALRQNPDLIVIGEIRDKVSAQAAIRAALTGHTVVSTIHVTEPNKLFDRLNELNCVFFKETLSYFVFIDNFQHTIYENINQKLIECPKIL